MPPKRDGNIAAFFPPKDTAKGKSKAEAVDTGTANTSSETPPTTTPSDQKAKGKRPLSSASLPASTTNKRPTKPTASSRKTHFSPADLPPSWTPSTADSVKDPSTPTLTLTVQKGDLFTAPTPSTLLIHACNTQGSWGAGIARAFRDRYPKAYSVYRSYCLRTHDPVTNPIPTGTALLIPPVDAGKKQWIGCLFTSAKYGRAKAKPGVIVANTGPAMEMLLELVRVAEESMNGEVNGKETGEGKGEGKGKGKGEGEGEGAGKDSGDAEAREVIREVRMCKINAGLFAVPWEKTAEALEGIVVREGWKGSVHVWEP